MTKLTPINNRVLIKQAAAETKTAGGLFIPTNVAEKPLEGEVLAVGKGSLTVNGDLIPMTVKAGDKVMFDKHRGMPVKLDGEDYLILREEDIIGVIDPA
jgi:chaperonin GroES